jgi:hypothetical protein
MTITKNEAPAGDERFTLKVASLQPSFAIDLVQDGLTLVLRDDSGAIETYQSMPSSGWTTDDGARWRYAGLGGAVISKAKLDLKNGELKLSIKGRGGDFRVDTAAPGLSLVFGGDAGASAGQCLTRMFGAGEGPACELSVKKLKCK